MAVPDETRRSLDRDADGFCRAFETPVPTLSKTSEAPVVAVHDDGTLDVGYGGAVLTVRMTTACSGVAVGDTVLLTAYGQMLYATGILARDNGHYVILGEGDCSVNSMVNHVVAVGYPQLNILALSARRTSGYFSTSGTSAVTSDAAFTLPEGWRLSAPSTFTSMSDHSPSWSVDFNIGPDGGVRMICTASGSANAFGYSWASAVILMPFTVSG